MKIYYTTSGSFRDLSGKDVFTKTLNYLTFKVGKKKVSTWTERPDVDNAVNLQDVIRKVKWDERNIRECDLFITDITDGSAGLGFEIGQAMSEKKQILVIRDKNFKARKLKYEGISAGLYKNIAYKEYSNIEELTTIIDRFLEAAKDQIDTKFLMILPAALDRYITWAAGFYRMHKAQVVRKAVETMMTRDKNWRNYRNNPEAAN